jgi:hypothetical protein
MIDMTDGREDWAAWQYRDECMRMQMIDGILHSASTRPLTEHEIRILAAEAGMGETYPKPTI